MKRHIHYLSTLFVSIVAISCTKCTEIKHRITNSTVDAIKEWLKTPTAGREAISDEWFYNRPLNKEEANHVMEALGVDFATLIADQLQKEWTQKCIQYKNYSMKFDYKTFGNKPLDGYSLYISLHGGGGTTAAINDQQWENQINLYQPQEGIYLAPRATTNTWDLWHQAQIDPMLDKLIQACILYKNVNPDRIYLLGYSAGGDGTYQLASRMADRWSAAAMMAGHPGDASPLNLRNIAFTLWVGENDDAYQRNKEMINYGKQLDILQKNDPKGYIHTYQLVPNKGHWMDLEDKVALTWMSQFTRIPYPTTIAWHQDNVTHKRFYWVSIPESLEKVDDEIIVNREGNTIYIQKSTPPKLTFWLNDSMVNLDEPISIIKEGQIIFKNKIPRTTKAIYESMKIHFDFSIMYSACITVEL
jgi:predicted esterase